MCLKRIYKNGSSKLLKSPYNQSLIRWKWANIDQNGRITSPYMGYEIHRDKWNHAKFGNGMKVREESICYEPDYHGMHVFVSKRKAGDYVREKNHRGVLLKVKVAGHLRSGKYQSADCETWLRYRVLEITQPHLMESLRSQFLTK